VKNNSYDAPTVIIADMSLFFDEKKPYFDLYGIHSKPISEAWKKVYDYKLHTNNGYWRQWFAVNAYWCGVKPKSGLVRDLVYHLADYLFKGGIISQSGFILENGKAYKVSYGISELESLQGFNLEDEIKKVTK
jgi:hypothetical protein